MFRMGEHDGYVVWGEEGGGLHRREEENEKSCRCLFAVKENKGDKITTKNWRGVLDDRVANSRRYYSSQTLFPTLSHILFENKHLPPPPRSLVDKLHWSFLLLLVIGSCGVVRVKSSIGNPPLSDLDELKFDIK